VGNSKDHKALLGGTFKANTVIGAKTNSTITEKGIFIFSPLNYISLLIKYIIFASYIIAQ